MCVPIWPQYVFVEDERGRRIEGIESEKGSDASAPAPNIHLCILPPSLCLRYGPGFRGSLNSSETPKIWKYRLHEPEHHLFMMQNASPSFLIPLTFPTPARLYSGNGDSPENYNLVESSCSAVHASVLASWGLSGTEPAASRGSVLGCKDGTLFVFLQPLGNSAATRTSGHSQANSFVETDVTSRPTTPLHARRHSRSAYSGPRSTSPSSLAFHQATFNMTSRSHVVSGLTKEQVEAPKNYVDFDDEPEKLKEMLKGNGLRDKTMTDNLVPSFDKELAIEKPAPPLLSLPSPPLKRKDDARSLLSATNSPPFTPRSLSAPPSPKLMSMTSSSSRTNQSLVLRYHIIPRHPGAVCAIHPIYDNRLFLVMQDNG